MNPNNRKNYVGALALALMLVGLPVHAAIIFQFSWDSSGSTPVPSTAVGSASGTFTLDAGPGESFTAADVLSLDITVTTNVHGSIRFDDLVDLVAFTGTVNGAGTSVSFIDVFLSAGGADNGFGCTEPDCANGQISFIDFTTDAYNYGSAEAARASFVTSVVLLPLPEPGVLALAGLALAGLALTHLRRPLQLRAADLR